MRKSEEGDPYDAHVQLASSLFRATGFELSAMQFKRTPEALAGLRRFNGLPDNVPEPFAWRYHPNAHMRDNWRNYYG